MLLSDKKLNKISDSNEEKTRNMFEEQDFKITKLDKNNKGRKSDFLIDDQKGKKFICEVKTIFSAGTGHSLNGNKPISHISTLKTDITNKDGVFKYDSFPKIQTVLEDAQSQYKELIAGDMQYNKLPLVVAVFLDAYADEFDLIPRDIFGLSLISAIIKLEKDYEIREACEKLTQEELKEIITKNDSSKLPPSSLKWKVLLNEKAAYKIDVQLLSPYIIC